MTDAQDKKIAQLEQEKQVAQELLFLVLDEIDEPVTFNIEEAKAKMRSDRMIDLQLDERENTWTLQVVTVSDATE